jgi:hypothetical protein
VAVALAAVAAGVVQLHADDAARTLAGLGRTRAVVVARHDLERGAVIGDDDVVVRRLPLDAVPDSALEQAPTGRTVTETIVGGEVVSSTRVAPDGVDGLAALVPVGRLAIAIPVEGTGLRVQVATGSMSSTPRAAARPTRTTPERRRPAPSWWPGGARHRRRRLVHDRRRRSRRGRLGGRRAGRGHPGARPRRSRPDGSRLTADG